MKKIPRFWATLCKEEAVLRASFSLKHNKKSRNALALRDFCYRA